jgi:hypothetical protein
MFVMQPAQSPSGGVPEIFPFKPQSAVTFLKGNVLAKDASGDVAEHGLSTAVTGVVGVAVEGVVSGVSDNPAKFTGTDAIGSEVNVAVANRLTRFAAPAYDGGAPVTTDAAINAVDIGDTYGIIKHTDDVHYIDLDDTTDVLVEVTKVVPGQGLRFLVVKFLESTLATP